jgi:hypothetical protein
MPDKVMKRKAIKEEFESQWDCDVSTIIAKRFQLRQERNLCSRTIPLKSQAPAGRHVPCFSKNTRADGARLKIAQRFSAG